MAYPQPNPSKELEIPLLQSGQYLQIVLSLYIAEKQDIAILHSVILL